MSITQDMLAYWRRPTLLPAREAFTPDTCIALFKLLGVSLGLVFLSAIIVGGVLSGAGATMPEPSEDFQDMMRSGSFVVMAIVYAPIIEELLFRSWLRKSWGILMVMPLLLCGSAIFILSRAASEFPMVSYAGILAIITAFGFYLPRYVSTRGEPVLHDRAARRVFPYVFWAMAVLFGLIHLGNFTDEGLGLLAVIVILPQFVMGAVLGFVRMRFGLIAAILFHAAYNAIMVTLTTLAPAAEPTVNTISAIF
ncbi:type II CAAX prenyl endopeptidase Rce1 family protein [Litorimonas sp. RW-G-Af-16]|uniref:CPBP family glutamic-type intramembrane protease n=1 Tax=Litorimonas sp. RW-G-Af-16 TaxID=3241168 RepID=UPI00390C95C9